MKSICGWMLAGMLGAGTLAQESAKKEPSKQEVTAEAKKNSAAPQQNKGISLIGKTVFDEKGRQLGRVQDLAADLEHGEIGYAVIEVNGEDAARKLPVPVRALKPGKDENSLVLNVSEKVLVALEVYRDEELPAADAFRVDSAVGRAATTEKGTGSSDSKKGTESKSEQK